MFIFFIFIYNLQSLIPLRYFIRLHSCSNLCRILFIDLGKKEKKSQLKKDTQRRCSGKPFGNFSTTRTGWSAISRRNEAGNEATEMPERDGSCGDCRRVRSWGGDIIRAKGWRSRYGIVARLSPLPSLFQRENPERAVPPCHQLFSVSGGEGCFKVSIAISPIERMDSSSLIVFEFELFISHLEVKEESNGGRGNLKKILETLLDRIIHSCWIVQTLWKATFY